MAEPKVEKMRFETYLAIINNSVGTKMFSEGYARIDGRVTNILNNGEVACAFYVTAILSMFDAKLIVHTHTTMSATLADLERSGWQKVDRPESGDIIIWGPKLQPDTDGLNHDHIGFYVGNERAVTNDFRRGERQAGGVPREIDWLYRDHPDGERKLKAIYRGRHLFESTG